MFLNKFLLTLNTDIYAYQRDFNYVSDKLAKIKNVDEFRLSKFFCLS